MTRAAGNGGFPAPPAGEPIRLVRARHAACGGATRVRLPREMPPRVVRRVVCDECAEPFEAERVEEIEAVQAVEAVGEIDFSDLLEPVEFSLDAQPADQVEAAEEDVAEVEEAVPEADRPRFRLPKLRRPKLRRPELRRPTFQRPSIAKARAWLNEPSSRTLRLGGIVAAGALVLGILFLVNGGSDESAPAPSEPATLAPLGTQSAKQAKANGQAQLIHGANFTIAMPAGWRRANAPNGAAFYAQADDGGADATLWISEEPKLDFPAFEAQSLEQLRALAGSARVVQRVPGPALQATITTLAADTPPGQPQYQVTLRASGPYRYYLATTVEPDAATETAEGAALIHNSLIPEG